jgi:hypothetical protein
VVTDGEGVLVDGSEQRLGACRGHAGELVLSIARGSPPWRKVETRRLSAVECGQAFDLYHLCVGKRPGY